MSDPMHEAATTSSSRPGPNWRRRGLLLWTVIVGVGAWWLLRGGGGEGATTVVRWGPDSSFGERLANGARLLRLNLGPFLVWLFLAPYVIAVALRFPLESGRWTRSLLIHLVAVGVTLALASGWRSRLPQQQTNIMVIRTEDVRQTEPRLGGLGVLDGPLLAGTNGHRFEAMIVVSNLVADFVSGANGWPGTSGAGLLKMGEISNLPPALQEILARTRERQAPDASKAGRVLTNDLTTTGSTGSLAGLDPVALHREISQTVRLPAPWWPRRWTEMLLDGLAYASLAGVAHAFAFHRRYRDRDRRALALESHLAQARLRGLQAQLQPHFLFNTLNGIATLVRRDARAAEEMLTALGELLRLSLHCADRSELPLREELELVGRYLEIQRMRFGGRLQVEQTIDPATLDAHVPAMLLQPLVENAIRHGLEPSAASGRLILSSQAESGGLRLEVRDNGLGLNPGPAPTRGGGVGLANLRARLAALYGPAASLELAPADGGGTRATVHLPWRPDESAAAQREPRP